jgi:branched-subunit amino acid transport protein
MPQLADGFGGYLTLFLVGFLVTEPWRWLGLVLGRNLDAGGDLFQWVRAVATALVAGLVGRMVLFPAGELAAVSAPVRIVAFVCGIALYLGLGRNLGAGVAGGSLLLMAGHALWP